VSERELYQVGERLAKEAVRAGVGAKQVRGLFVLAKTSPYEKFEAHIKYQTARASGGGRGGPQGFDLLGPTLIKELERFRENKPDLLRALSYMNMLYPYEERFGAVEERPSREPLLRGSQATPDWEAKLEPVVRGVCGQYGFAGLRVERQGGGLLCTVRLLRFRGDPKPLSDSLAEAAVNHFPDLSGGIRFWIDRDQRRM
jgi:hypothetical protein